MEAKFDAGKLELDLVPAQIVRDVAEVRMYGNKKYGDPENWRTVELRRYVNALLRHTLAFVEDYASRDEESGIEHYKHMACNIAFICEMMREHMRELEYATLMREMSEKAANVATTATTATSAYNLH